MKRIPPALALTATLVLTSIVGGPTACGPEPSAGTGAGEDARAGPAAGRPAPPFALETLTGDSLTLADLAGTPVVLMNFWASWCLPCKAEVPDLMALHEEYSGDGFMVLGVTVNDLPRDARAFVEELGMNYPSVIGTPQMLEAYGLSPWLPTTLLLQDGRIVEEWVGPRTRRQLEYPIQVALGQAPPLEDVIGEEGGEGGEER